MTQLINIEPALHLASFTIFDIGANKSYLNQGQIDHECRTVLVTQLKELLALLPNCTTPLTLSFSGACLNFLAEEQPELIKEFDDMFSTNSQLKLATQLYHGTALDLISEEQAQKHLLMHKDLLTKHFKTAPTVLFTTSKASQHLLTFTACTEQATAVDSVSLAAYLAAQEHVLPQLESELQQHVIAECRALAPHVQATDDEELIGSFCQLASPRVIGNVHPEYGETPYDHYTTFMSILHDIAHRINAARHIQQGVFIAPHKIGASPSALLE
jgi:hypothetical protein